MGGRAIEREARPRLEERERSRERRRRSTALPFVSDGSQFTTGGAENPTLTIVTLAIRQADYIADQMKSNTI